MIQKFITILLGKGVLPHDWVSDKGWKLGASCHKINYNFFSIGEPLKVMVVEFITNLVDSSYLGCPMHYRCEIH